MAVEAFPHRVNAVTDLVFFAKAEVNDIGGACSLAMEALSNTKRKTLGITTYSLRVIQKAHCWQRRFSQGEHPFS